MRLCSLLLIALTLVCLQGCGGSSPPPDYSKKPDPNNPTPYVPKNYKGAIEPPNAGPKQTYPRPKAGGN
jgi:hypothetical protein